jgi:5-methylcytosine-specific restriction endonuclease McrA
MPTAAPRPCASCHRLVYTDRCPTCTKARPRRHVDARRGTAHSRGYTARWARVSRSWLARYPWCGQRQDGALDATHSRCVQLGQRRVAQCVDHIIPLRDGGALVDPSNLQSLCFRCNSLKG